MADRFARPTSVLGLFGRAASLKRRELAWTVAAILLVLLAFCLLFHTHPRATRVATFNIENFPQHARQIDGAFAVLDALDADIVAVQEITDPARFRVETERRLGRQWRFVADSGGRTQRLGVLYDGSRYTLASTETHDDTQVTAGAKPTLEVRLRRRDGGRAVRLFVVHLKAGGEFAAVRREQLRRLMPRVQRAVKSWDEVLVLGDFNATGEPDREALALFGRRVELVWASQPLECTSYWSRRDGCIGAALDHVFTRAPPRSVAARGPCETDGCHLRDRCPTFHRDVSDHCPVTLDL